MSDTWALCDFMIQQKCTRIFWWFKYSTINHRNSLTSETEHWTLNIIYDGEQEPRFGELFSGEWHHRLSYQQWARWGSHLQDWWCSTLVHVSLPWTSAFLDNDWRNSFHPLHTLPSSMHAVWYWDSNISLTRVVLVTQIQQEVTSFPQYSLSLVSSLFSSLQLDVVFQSFKEEHSLW